VKTIAETLGAARSNLIERRDDTRPKRGPQDRPGDLDLSADIRRLVDRRPTPAFAGAGSMATAGSPRSSSASGDPTAWPLLTPSASTG